MPCGPGFDSRRLHRIFCCCGTRTLIDLCGQRAECSAQGQRDTRWGGVGVWEGLSGALASRGTP